MAPQGAMHAIMKIWRMMYTHGGRARPMGASERRAAALLSLQHHADAEAPGAGASPALGWAKTPRGSKRIIYNQGLGIYTVSYKAQGGVRACELA